MASATQGGCAVSRKGSGVVDRLSASAKLAGTTAPVLGILKAGDNPFALPGVLTEDGWHIPANLSYAEWEQAGRNLGLVGKMWRMWVGDWINYGEAEYGEKYSQALDVLGLDYSQLTKYASIAKAVRPDLALWVTEWNRPPLQVVPFTRMLRLEAEAAFWFCASDAMVPGFGLLGTPAEQLYAASAY